MTRPKESVVYGPITAHLAKEKIHEDLRRAGERQRLKVHARQRSLVLASLLLSRRKDAPTHRRSLPSEV
jgi:hypothetical protein